VCYYSGPQDAVYERLGHAEVVQVQLDGSKAEQEMQKFADVSADHPLTVISNNTGLLACNQYTRLDLARCS
jgi:hypothetical protein